ncbi:hypothetical protein D3C72_880490 [compost metagenome]
MNGQPTRIEPAWLPGRALPVYFGRAPFARTVHLLTLYPVGEHPGGHHALCGPSALALKTYPVALDIAFAVRLCEACHHAAEDLATAPPDVPIEGLDPAGPYWWP